MISTPAFDVTFGTASTRCGMTWQNVAVCCVVQLYRKFEQSRQYQRVLAVTGGVIASVIVAPLLSLLSVGKILAYIGIIFNIQVLYEQPVQTPEGGEICGN